ncbi:hypothetical protein QZH41_009516, partial [Actinostola sp. cb2023]
MRPHEVAKVAQKSAGPRKGGGGKAAAIKVGRGKHSQHYRLFYSFLVDSGRVKVFVRVRPLKQQEVSRKETVAVDVSELNTSVCNTLCKPIVTSALNGFNGTLMAYGQTGSGKTYTLMAPDGIAAGVVDRCFKRIMQDTKHDYKLSMSYLQIYQEKIYDLLNSTNKVDLSLREHPQKGVYVENLSEFVVRSPSEIMNLLAVGKKRLVFAETKMNRTSSRSHSVCMLLIERTLSKEEGNKPNDCVPNGGRRSKSYLIYLDNAVHILIACHGELARRKRCDLAGSERLKKTQAEGERLSEAQHINLSLLELGNVIHALADGTTTHVPFRNSTLTRLLQESLGGNCKTSLIVCVSPTFTDVSETKGTLQFGSRAMKITNTAYVNVEVNYKKLSDDLTKMLNSREKDLEDIKESYENRIEKIKMEAEGQMNSSMMAAQEALSSVRSLFDSKEEGHKNEIIQIDEELQREKLLSSELQEQLSSLGTCLRGGVHRAKSALLAELLSMQIFYTISDMPEEERQEVAKAMQHEYLYSGKQLVGVREKVLENTDNVLQLFQSYLKLLDQSGKDMASTGLNLRDLEGVFLNGEYQECGLVANRVLESKECLDSNNLEPDHLELTCNKTDDDKVMESDISDLDDQGPKVSDFLLLTKTLRDKLGTIKGSLDSEAIDFLKKAFAMDGEKECNKKQVYGAMMEFLRQRECSEADERPQDQSSIPMLDAEMALLDQSLCHVVIDKALQSSILLLECTASQKECTQLSKNNGSLNKELEVMRLQVETLVSENTKLNSKLSETSNFLQDVKTSKELLERIGISSANNGTCQLQNNNDAVIAVDIIEKKSTQVELTVSNGHSESSKDNSEDENAIRKKSVSKKLVDIEQFLLNLQDELIKLEDDESALFSHTNRRQVVSSLRLNLNKRLGELWSIEVVESKKLRARVDELTIKLESATYDFEKQIEDLEKELYNESQVRLNLEKELLQYRKEVMDLGSEIWTLSNESDYINDEISKENRFSSASDAQIGAVTVPDETDSVRRHSSCSLSISRCNSDDSLHDKRQKAELYLAEVDAKKSKEELTSLKQTFLQLNQDLADSGKVRQEMEERFVHLVNENKVITLKFKAYEEKNHALEEKVIRVSTLKTTLQEELLKVKEAEHVHLEEIRGYKEKIATFEVEKTKLKQELSKMEIKFTSMDNRYQEMNKELVETKRRLKEAQLRLKDREQELADLHEAYDRLRSHIDADDSDRESVVEVKMKSGARGSPTPSRIQSIHLVSRARSQSKKKPPSFLAAKKKMSMKRSPRNDEISPRRNTLKKGTIGKRGTLTSPRDSKTLTRGDSERDSLKRAKVHERQTLKHDNEDDQKLKSELLLAKEQLIRLKGELTLSNIQTANLGTHLTSLREDSNKLDVELSSMRRTPVSKGASEDSYISSRNNSLEIQLGNAKEKIIELQDRILTLRREKTSAEEKVSHSEEEVKQLRSELYKARDSLDRSQDVVKILKKELELLETKNQILQQRLTSYSTKTTQMFLAERDGTQDEDSNSSENPETLLKVDQEKLAQYEQDKMRLEKEIEQLSNEKVKLEDMQNLVQQLVEVEDEQLLLKRRLRKVVKQAKKDDSEEDHVKTNGAGKTEPKRNSLRTVNVSQQSSDNKLEEYYVENTALRCELDALRIYICNLENENKTVKYKLSISESMHGNSDKRVLATLLASAKHEREELRETLNGVYSEKEDMEESLNVARIKNQRLQRELSQETRNRNDLEKELDSLKTDIPEMDKPSTSLTVEESRFAELVKGFLYSIGTRNAKEKDIKEFAKTLLARKIQLTGKNTKSVSIDQRQPWNRNSSLTRISGKRKFRGTNNARHLLACSLSLSSV